MEFLVYFIIGSSLAYLLNVWLNRAH